MSQKGQQYKTKHTDITPHIAVAIASSIYNERVIREARRPPIKNMLNSQMCILMSLRHRQKAENKIIMSIKI